MSELTTRWAESRDFGSCRFRQKSHDFCYCYHLPEM